MESTGVYWKPVWNVLEGQFELVLANAQLVKALEGEKTDTKIALGLLIYSSTDCCEEVLCPGNPSGIAGG